MYLDVQLVKKIFLFEHSMEDNLDIRFTISLGYTREIYCLLAMKELPSTSLPVKQF